MRKQERGKDPVAGRPAGIVRIGGRPSRRVVVFDEAAMEFNARGLSGASLDRIARRAGLTRAALYYHFSDREDLVFQCYLRSCASTADDLDVAAREGRTGLERVLAYVRRALDPERRPEAVLSEIPYLGGPSRKRIEALHGANVDRLRGFIEEGIADRSVRQCDAEVVSQAIVGVLAWVPLSASWIRDAGGVLRTRAAGAVADMVADGVAADPVAAFSCPIDVSVFARRPTNAFDRRQAKALKVEQLVRTASRLFNRHGIEGTSLDDITAALGATKGAFYQHVADKRALVILCYESAYGLFESFADAAEAAGRTGAERALFGGHLNAQAQAADLSPLAPLTGVAALPARSRERLMRRARRLGQRFTEFGRQGIADGSLRPYDVQSVAIAAAGASGWIPKWFADDDPRTPRAVADEIVALFAHGLRRKRR